MTAPTRRRARLTLWLELVWFVVSVGAFAAFVWGLAWAYPLGRGTIWTIGGLAVLVVAAMGASGLRRAWSALQGAAA